MISSQEEYGAEIAKLKSALETPDDNVSAVLQRCRGVIEKDVIPYIDQSLLTVKSTRDYFDKWSGLVQLLPAIRKIQGLDDGNAQKLGEIITSAVLDNFSITAEPLAQEENRHNIDKSQSKLRTMFADLQELAFYATSDQSIRDFKSTVDVIEEYAPHLGSIPHHAHYVWLSGKSDGNTKARQISLEGLVNAARYLHLHPNGKVSLWTDDLPGVKATIETVIDDAIESRNYMSASKDSQPSTDGHHLFEERESQYEELIGLLQDADMSLFEFRTSLNKIIARPWQDIPRDWNALSSKRKNILESAINNFADGSAPLRYPAIAKDLIATAAVAKEGGVALNLNIACKKQLNIFDAFGFQYVALERDQNKKPVPFAHYEMSCPVLAATKNSPAALRAIERMIDFVASPTLRFEKMRGAGKELMMGRSKDNNRYVLPYQLSEQPAHAMADLFGPNCYRRFRPHINYLLHLLQRNEVFSGYRKAQFTGLKVDPSSTRRASDPGNTVGKMSLGDFNRETLSYKATYDPLGIYAEEPGAVKTRKSIRDYQASFKSVFHLKSRNVTAADAVPTEMSTATYEFKEGEIQALQKKYPNETLPKAPILATEETRIDGGKAIGRNKNGDYLFRIPKAGSMKLVLVTKELLKGRQYVMDERTSFKAGTEMTKHESEKQARSFRRR